MLNKYPLDNAGGRKFLIVVLLIVAAIAALFIGKATFEQFLTAAVTFLGYYFGTKKNDTPAT